MNNDNQDKSTPDTRSEKKRPDRRPRKRHPQKDKNKNGHVYGVIDLGTNNCRLLVAVQNSQGFKVIDSFSRIVRLGEGFSEGKKITESATERTISALKVCVDKMNRRGVTHMWNVATQACREAENGVDFVKAVEENVNIKLNIIDPKEEARLAVMGCKALLDTKYNRGVVFDIGGGSTEVIWVEYNHKRRPEIIDWISIPLGVVNLSEEYGTKDALSDAHYIEMKDRIKEHIVPFEETHNISDHITENNVQLMGTSGTVTTLTSMHLNQTYYDRSAVDGAWMKSSDLIDICTDLAKMDFKQRLALNNIGNDRAELVVAGCAIFDAIVDVWPIDDVRVADRGIREGMLHDLMDQQRRENNKKRRKRNRKRYYLNRKKKKAEAQNKEEASE
ncbi:MAG: Ppx/GppA family phosphatase [Kordiimonadaceae bacterium]|mgnify:CR=1 FL=1|jgi:exopolyphosphatase / guanosine-5'-triphosphate,3'-diphosphate pyrophosphatase|nr:Ppx/GppA family phosphatase [Kordiimonadaceae bacterium]MBT6031476.1 Ppx/GppA family phosphatase [Kordiimonadaceae bacterium]